MLTSEAIRRVLRAMNGTYTVCWETGQVVTAGRTLVDLRPKTAHTGRAPDTTPPHSPEGILPTNPQLLAIRQP